MIRAGTVAAVPVAVGVFANGGYAPAARVAFALAALAMLAFRRVPMRWARDPVVIVLLGLAALGALSALWTLGPADRTVRWALVCLGWAAVAMGAAHVASQPGGVGVLAGAVAVIAVAAGAIGLVAAAVAAPPYAERIAGVWRPGGPFEYPPALALLEVSALPALLGAMAARSPRLAGAGAAGIAVAGGVLALSASRVSLGLAVAAGGLALSAPAATVRARRAVVGGALGVGTASGVVLALAGDGASPALRLALLIAVVGVAALTWPAVAARSAAPPAGPVPARPTAPPPARAASPGAGRRAASRNPRQWAAVALIAAAALAAGGLAFGTSAGRGAGPAGGFLHGRGSTWRAALETFSDRPLSGAGADAFLAGSARHQGGQTIAFAHNLPLELAAELGVAGIALAIALYAASARGLWRMRGTAAAWLLGPAAAAFLLASLLDWPWHLAGAGAVWALATGALAGSTAIPAGTSSRVGA
jgi:hypothetical protein